MSARVRRLRRASLDDLRVLRASIDGEIARRAGEGLVVDDRNGPRECPPGGALLIESWAVSDCDVTRWYSTADVAYAALVRLAIAEGRTVTKGRMHVDLTSPGCHSSCAYVRDNDPAVAS